MPKRISKSMREYLKMEKRLSETGAKLYQVLHPSPSRRRAFVTLVDSYLSGNARIVTGFNDRHFAECIA